MTKRRYQIKELYLGWIEYMEEEMEDKVIAFQEVKDKFHPTPIYVPVRTNVGYHYIKTMKPLSETIEANKRGKWITIRELDQVLQKVNQNKEATFIVVREETKPEPTLEPTDTKQYLFEEEREKPKEKPKVMRYQARRNRFIA